MKSTVIVLCFFLASCASGEYYKPDVPWLNTQTIGASCSGKYQQYREKIKEGVIIEIGGPFVGATTVKNFKLAVLFRIAKGHSVQLKSEVINVYIDGAKTETILRIKSIESGIPETTSGEFPLLKFNPLDKLNGTSRSDHIKLPWGVYSTVTGEGEVYRLQSEILSDAPQSVEVHMPSVSIDGEDIKISPILFRKTVGTSACI